MTDLAHLRLRVAPEPRPLADAKPVLAPRRVELVHARTDDEGRLVAAVRLGMLDGLIDEVMMTWPGHEDQAAAWAAAPQLPAGAEVAAVGIGQFVRGLLKRCWQRRNSLTAFGIPAILALLSTDARRSGAGVSLGLLGAGSPSRKTPGKWADSSFYPRVAITSRGSEEAGAYVRLQPPWHTGGRHKTKPLGGPATDLQVLGSALGAVSSSPAALCRSYGGRWPDLPDFCDQLLAEALALAEVYGRMLDDLAEVAPGLAPQACWSAGSIAAAALQDAGVRAPAETMGRLPRWVLGACASACHGGLAEALLVGVPLPMAIFDVRGTYPGVFSLLRLTPHLAADRFEVEAVPVGEVRRLFEADGFRGRLDDPWWWTEVGTLFIEVEPHGEPLPCVRETPDRWRSVVAGLDFGGGKLWFHAADLVRPALAGRLPKLRRAFRVVAVGTAESLRPVRLPSGAICHLTTGDLGKALWHERELAAAIIDPPVRDRRVALSKALAVSAAWGIFGRVDLREDRKAVPWEAWGPNGERFQGKSRRYDQAGPLTLWHLAAAVPAACRAIVAIASHDIEAAGGSVAAVMTDSITLPAAPEARLVPCPGGPHRLADGSEAVRLLSFADVRSIFSRFDKLFGRQAWKAEAGSLDRETWGLVAGVNKVLFGHFEGETFTLDRSSDTSLGDHYLDPSGTSAKLPDGRTAWAAELERAHLARLVARASDADVQPDNLPSWSEDRPAMRPGRGTTMADLRWLRHQLGDPTVPAFARYVRAGEAVCLGADRDPATWRSWPWYSNGTRCQVGVLGLGGELSLSEAPATSWRETVVVPTIGEVFERWQDEHDPTVAGPKAGLRHVLAVQSHPALVEYVGRSGEATTGRDDALRVGVGGTESLRQDARRVGPSELVARGVPRRTAMRASVGKTEPRRPTVERLAAAVAEGQAKRSCAGCGGDLPPRSRAGRRWCSEGCRKGATRGRFMGSRCAGCNQLLPKGSRPGRRWCSDACRTAFRRGRAGQWGPSAQAQPSATAAAAPPELLERALSLLADLPGLPDSAAPVLRRSTKLRGLLGRVLGTVTPEALAEAVEAEGPLRGESPVGILVARVEALGPVLAVGLAQRRQAHLAGARRRGYQLGAMQRAGQLPEETAEAELRLFTDPELRRAALEGYATGLGVLPRRQEALA